MDTVLLETARSAAAAGDEVRLTAALRTWSALSVRDGLPQGLERPAADAIAFAKARGMLRLFGSRVSDRIRVGVADPANIVDRIDAWLVTDDGLVRLSRLEGGATGRFEYRVDPTTTAGRTVMLDAVSTRFGQELRLRRTTLVASEPTAVPSAPDLARLEKNVFEKAPPRPTPQTVHDEPAVVWWVVVGGVIAAAFAGAGIYQELR